MSYIVFLIVSLLCCSVGFYMYIWFFSVGYGFAIAGIGLALLIGFRASLGVPEMFACLLLVAYGLRLGGYLLYREKKNAAYRTVLSPEMECSKKMPISAKIDWKIYQKEGRC